MAEELEKIYAYIPDDDIVGTASTQKGFPHQFVIEEYTRTDAFIKKACYAYCKVCGHYAHTTPIHICRQACDYYKDFKEYIERGNEE
jgi:hypothetical protein